MKQCSKVICVIGIVGFIAGMVLLFGSVNWGMDAANAAIQKNGGVMDTERFYYIMQSTRNVYLIAGGVVSAIGGVVAVAFGYLAVKGET